jgi:hypothetical protein
MTPPPLAPDAIRAMVMENPAEWQRGAIVTGERRVRAPSVQSSAELLARHERQHVDQIPQILRAITGAVR